MNNLIIVAIFGFIFLFNSNIFGFSQEDFLEDLLENENTWESDEFKMLGGINDEVLIEMKVNLTNRRQSHISRIAEVIVKTTSKNRQSMTNWKLIRSGR